MHENKPEGDVTSQDDLIQDQTWKRLLLAVRHTLADLAKKMPSVTRIFFWLKTITVRGA
jgi:hypothetical protein